MLVSQGTAQHTCKFRTTSLWVHIQYLYLYITKFNTVENFCVARFLHADDRVTTLARGKFFQTFWPNPCRGFISDTYKTDRQGLHWSNWQDTGALTQGAQEGLNIRQCVPISDCRACDEWVPYNQMGGSRGGGPSSTLLAEMCFRSMAHQDRAAQIEPRWPLPLVSLSWLVLTMSEYC